MMAQTAITTTARARPGLLVPQRHGALQVLRVGVGGDLRVLEVLRGLVPPHCSRGCLESFLLVSVFLMPPEDAAAASVSLASLYSLASLPFSLSLSLSLSLTVLARLMTCARTETEK